jgi:hypothetical protein
MLTDINKQPAYLEKGNPKMSFESKETIARDKFGSKIESLVEKIATINKPSNEIFFMRPEEVDENVIKSKRLSGGQGQKEMNHKTLPIHLQKDISHDTKQSFFCFQKISENASEMVDYGIKPSKTLEVQPNSIKSLHFENELIAPKPSLKGMKQFTFADLGSITGSNQALTKPDPELIADKLEKEDLYAKLDDQISNIVGVLTNFNISLKNLVKTKAGQDTVLKTQPGSPSSLSVNTNSRNRASKIQTLDFQCRNIVEESQNPAKKPRLSKYQQLLKNSLVQEQKMKEITEKTKEADKKSASRNSNTKIRGLINEAKLKVDFRNTENFQNNNTIRFSVNSNLPNDEKHENVSYSYLCNSQKIRCRESSLAVSKPVNISNLRTTLDGKRTFENVKSKISQLLRAKSYGLAVKCWQNERRSHYTVDKEDSKSFVNRKSEIYLKTRQNIPIEESLLNKGEITKQKHEDLRNFLKPSHKPKLVAKQPKRRSTDNILVFDRLYNQKSRYSTVCDDKLTTRPSYPLETKRLRMSSSQIRNRSVYSDKQQKNFFISGNSHLKTAFDTPNDFQDYYIKQIRDSARQSNFLLEAISVTPKESKLYQSISQQNSKNDTHKSNFFKNPESVVQADMQNSKDQKAIESKRKIDSIYEESKKWQSRRAEKITGLAQKAEEDKIKECTFHPKVLKKRKNKENTKTDFVDVTLVKDGRAFDLIAESKANFLKFIASRQPPFEKGQIKENPFSVNSNK